MAGYQHLKNELYIMVIYFKNFRYKYSGRDLNHMSSHSGYEKSAEMFYLAHPCLNTSHHAYLFANIFFSFYSPARSATTVESSKNLH